MAIKLNWFLSSRTKISSTQSQELWKILESTKNKCVTQIEFICLCYATKNMKISLVLLCVSHTGKEKLEKSWKFFDSLKCVCALRPTFSMESKEHLNFPLPGTQLHSQCGPTNCVMNTQSKKEEKSYVMLLL